MGEVWAVGAITSWFLAFLNQFLEMLFFFIFLRLFFLKFKSTLTKINIYFMCQILMLES